MSNKQYQDNTGILFLNNNAKNPKAPQYKGKYNHLGKVYDIAGWKKTKVNPETGETEVYLSLKTSEPWKKEGGSSGGYSDVDEAF